MTERLYDADAYLKEFTARVVRCEAAEQGWDLVLDRTAFYPEGGGQPCDLGTIGCSDSAVSVTDVQEAGGEIVHRCSGPLSPGAEVVGRIDWDVRLGHMREHSGEHILSGIICRTHGYSNVGFHMGKDCVTIDFSGPLTAAQIAQAQRMANEKVLENVEIEARYPKKEELDALEYRSKKEIEGAVRIVTVPGADVCACCGTHVKRTGEIGPIKVIGSESFRGGVRLQVLIGEKALADSEMKEEQVRRICALLSAKPEQTADAVQRLQDAAGELRFALGALQEQLLELKAEAQRGKKFAVLFEEELSPVQTRKLADRLQENAAFAAVFSGNDADGYRYVICSASVDVAALGKDLNRALDGRGGGRNPMIQGSLFAPRAAVEAFLKEKELMEDD